MSKVTIQFYCDSKSHENAITNHTVEYLGYSIIDKIKNAVLKCKCERCAEEARKQSKPVTKTIKYISMTLWHNYCDEKGGQNVP